MKTVSLLATLLALTGCTPTPPPKFQVMVRVESDPGLPLSAARLTREGSTLAHSSETGEMIVELQGLPGDTVRLGVTCPQGFRAPADSIYVLLRRLDERGKRPEFRVACPPLTRKLVIAVRANHGPGLPLRYLGQEIARTDSDGAALALITAAPGDTLSLTLDTSGDNADPMPRNPELKLNVADRDDLVVFDQAFTRPVVKSAPRVRRKLGPQRI